MRVLDPPRGCGAISIDQLAPASDKEGVGSDSKVSMAEGLKREAKMALAPLDRVKKCIYIINICN